MGYIKNLHLIGFKKFKNFSIDFNQAVNILVGENESGKSTVIEALDVLLNKTYENSDKYILSELFNSDCVKGFTQDPSFETLPSIEIIGEFELNDKDKYSGEFYGVNWKDSDRKTSKYGIWFKCQIDKELKPDIAGLLMKGIIPYEYYSLTWTTFKNEPYNRLRKTISFVPIDSSNSTNYNAFDNYAKRLFLKKCEDALPKVKTDFNEHMDTGFASLCLPDFETGKKFGLNHKKLILENIVGILDHNILIENKGRGEEKIIKTNLSLDDKQNNDVIAIEEPENNLSHGNLRKLIKSIESKCAGKQLIVTTHSALIVTGLSLENVIWITENDKKMLKDLDKKKTSDYFKKLENDNLLRFILANKVILVEGPTEALLLPRMYSQENTRTLDEEGIDIISCNGLSFEKYLEIGEALNKKVAVLTDNDGDKKKIDRWNAVNSTKEMTKVYMAQDPVDYTWEVCVKKANEELVGKILPVDRDAEYLVNGKSFEDKTLAYMLLHKVDVSLKLIESGQHIAIPNHVKELLEWIKK